MQRVQHDGIEKGMDQLSKSRASRGSEKVLSDQLIRSHLQHVLAHKEFHATDKMRDFLRFIVEESLAGRSRQLKGFTIATEVYGRGADFDAAHDPVVRIQAGRLRRAIERYYLVGGVHDPVRIRIPKGSYAPVFSPAPAAARDTGATRAAGSAGELWPTILVTPFKNITGQAELDYLCNGLAGELCAQLGDYSDFRVITYREDVNSARMDDLKARFVVCGTVHTDRSTMKIAVQLVENENGEQLWSEKFSTPADSLNLIEFQENAARSIAVHVAGERGVIARKLSAESSSVISDHTTHEAILKAYVYEQVTNAESYFEAFEALQGALEKDPRCGLVPGRLALLYADNIAMEFFDLEQTPLERALHLAREAVLMEPNNQLNRLVLARVRMLNNECDAALVEIDAALNLNPNSLRYMDGIGYLLMLLGKWERGAALISKAIELNPFYRVYVHYGTWLNWFRQAEYLKALEELELTLGVGGFWEPLARAATLGQLGFTCEAGCAVEDLLILKPNFPERANILIGHYVKFADIAEKVVEGLEKAGLKLPLPPPRKQ